MIYENLVRRELFSYATGKPVFKVTDNMVNSISLNTGISIEIVRDISNSIAFNPLNIFEAAYYDMALKGREKCTEFEKATSEIFQNGFDFISQHVGAKPLHPDVFVISNINGYSGIIDTKAYAHYSIINDHKNRMIHNYIPRYENENLKFFMYVAGGFKSTINRQLAEIYSTTNIGGCAITAVNMLNLLRKYSNTEILHDELFSLFTANKNLRV